MNTIAEAFIKVKLGLDKNDLKSMTQDQLAEVSKSMDKHVMNLRRQARNYKIIGFELGKISKAMFKYMVAPGVALGTAGVMKYMQTTEKGASLLRYSMVELRWSFDQFLARVGKTIYDSGILTKVINKLKDILDNLDAEKIKQIFNVVKWGAILYIVTGITSKLMLWEGAIRRGLAALMSLGKVSLGAEIAGTAAAGGVGATAAKGAAKTGAKKLGGEVATGAAITAGAGGTGGGIYALIKSLNHLSVIQEYAAKIQARGIGQGKINASIPHMIKNMWRMGQEGKVFKTYAPPTRNPITGRFMPANEFAKDSARLLSKLQPLVDFFGKIGKLGTAFGAIFKGLLRFATGLFILDAAVHLMKGAGAKWSSTWDLIKDVSSKIWLGVKLIWSIVTGIYDGLMAMFEALGSILKNLFTLRWGQIFDDLADIGIKAWEESLSKIGVAIGNIITPLEGETAGNKLSRQRKAANADPFRFLPTGTSTTTFAGLHEAAQEMINKENEMNSRNKNTDAVLANTDANKELKEAMLRDAEEIKNFNSGKGSSNWGLMDIVMPYNKVSPYANSLVQYGNINPTNSSNAKTM